MKGQQFLDKLKKIKILALDFDGVLTDGYVYFQQNGMETVRCSRKDSLGTNMLQKAGIGVVVIRIAKLLRIILRSEKAANTLLEKFAI